MNRREFFGSAATLSAGLAIGPVRQAKASAVPSYRVVYVESPDGSPTTSTSRMNDRGELVGSYRDTDSGLYLPYLYRLNDGMTGGEFIPVKSLLPPDAPAVMPFTAGGINNSGVISGEVYEQVDGIWLKSSYRLHPPAIAGGSWSYEQGPRRPQGTGASGQVTDAGDSVFISHVAVPGAPTEIRVFVWPAGAADYVDLGVAVASPGANMRASDCHRAPGEDTLMISAWNFGPAPSRAFRLEYSVGTGAKVYTSLGGLSRSPDDDAAGINRLGTVVGAAVLSTKGNTTTYRAYVWESSTGMRALGTFGGEDSQAEDINDAGDVVGHAEYPAKRFVAPVVAPFLYRSGQMYDLRNLVAGMPNSSTLFPEDNLRINNQGIIFGTTKVNGGTKAYILIPTS
jgi:probable HAF family extracellular repeat protein